MKTPTKMSRTVPTLYTIPILTWWLRWLYVCVGEIEDDMSHPFPRLRVMLIIIILWLSRSQENSCGIFGETTIARYVIKGLSTVSLPSRELRECEELWIHILGSKIPNQVKCWWPDKKSRKLINPQYILYIAGLSGCSLNGSKDRVLAIKSVNILYL